MKRLAGKRVLVTRAREQATSLAALLREEGAEPVIVPTIEIVPPADPEPLAHAVRGLGRDYDWVAFTSANAVDQTWAEVLRQGRDARAFDRVRIAAVGPGTARTLASHGLAAHATAKDFRGEGLAEELLRAMALTSGARILFPRAKEGREVFPETLRAHGCSVDVVTAYETRAASGAEGELRSLFETGTLDAVTFTSGSTVENLVDVLGPRARELLARVTVASIGPVTTEAALRRGVRVDATAKEATVASLVEALAAGFGHG
jgi:uroporphyrinogen III methyltransferase/synthase